jgi:hypothetical protein
VSRRSTVAAALLWVAALAALVAATVAGFALLPKYTALGPTLRLWPPPEPAAAGDDSFFGWTVERGRGRVEVIDGLLRLEAPRTDPYVLLRRPLPVEPEVRAFRVRAEARFAGFGGARTVDAARIHLAGRDEAGRLLPDRREDALNTRSTRDWTSVRADLAPPPGAASVELLVRLQRATGVLELRHLEIEPLVEAPWRGPLRLTLALAWLAACAAGALLLVRNAAHRHRVAAALAAAAGGLVLILSPPDLLAILLPGPLVEALGRNESVPYLGHLGLSATLAFLCAWATGARSRALPALLVLVAAAAGEAVQLLSVGRDASPWDALANAAGGIGGLELALVAARFEVAGTAPGLAENEPAAVIERALPLVPLRTAQSADNRAPDPIA